MRRAIDLAKLAINPGPNPKVGCEIVSEDGKIIGEGFHQMAGMPHAERVAGENTLNNDYSLAGASVYVTLEPCAHQGRTGPCAAYLVKQKVAKVVIGMLDPNPLVAGKGIAILKSAGIEVVVGGDDKLEEACQAINVGFLSSISGGLPKITLKWAETADGFFATKEPSQKWITGPLAKVFTHKLRAESDAIIVGKHTQSIDSPQLNVRHWPSENQPCKVVLGLPPYESGQELEDILQALSLEGVRNVLVEGGISVLNNFIAKGLWDEAYVFTGPSKWGEGRMAPLIPHGATWSERIGPDWLNYFIRPGGLLS